MSDFNRDRQTCWTKELGSLSKKTVVQWVADVQHDPWFALGGLPLGRITPIADTWP